MKHPPILLASRILISDILRFKQQLYPEAFHIEQAVNWLCQAQDSAQNGGVSEGYHLYHGWLPPYPETTGYIIETFLNYHYQIGGEAAKIRAIKMADWLISIQNDDGSIPDSYFNRKMVFDTGQVIFGLIRCYEEIGSSQYLASAERAGKWLVQVQEAAETFGRRFGRPVRFEGEPGPALLGDSSLCASLLGPPAVPLARLLDWVAAWVEQGGRSLGKPTHFEATDGRF